jgi:cell surface protein SprA
MFLKTASFTYSETNGILLPGFDPRPKYLGQAFNYQNTDSGYANGAVSTAPGWGFVFGDQRDIRPDAVRYNWLSHDTALNNSYLTTALTNFTARATLEPIKNFKVELSANRNFTLAHQEYFRIDNDGSYRTFSPTETGNFSMSYFTWNTAFINDNPDYSNETFKKFSEYRSHFSQLLGRQNPFSTGADPETGYRSGYGSTQQEVLTASFLAAYGDKSPTSSMINKFPKIPLPNWKVTYDGLGKIKLLQTVFTTISLTHGYRSTYSVNSFNQNLLYQENDGSPIARDTVGNFIPTYDFQQVTIAEQMAPLFGLDMTWKNSLQTRFEIKKDRTLTLSYANIQVTEVRGTEYTLGLGYKIKKFTLPFRIGSTKKKLSSPLNLRADFNLRTNTTIIRKLVEGTNQPSAGTETISYKVSADYAINERFNVNAFFERQITNPFVSTSYPNSRTEAGIKLRFTLTP